MKRFFTLIAIISITLVAMAQRPLVTLSHDGELSFFSSLSAFEEALDAAQNGDIIYLSEGNFTSNANVIDIEKKVSIVGCGYKSHILANIQVDLRSNPTDDSIQSPMFDGVRLQKLTFYNHSDSRKNLKNVEIRKSWIRELNHGGFAGNDFKIDRCRIEIAEFDGANSNNTYVSNSKIGEIIGASGGHAINVINCNIGKAHYCPRSVISSIIGGGTGYTTGINGGLLSTGTHSIYNSWLPDIDILYNKDNFYIENCYFEYPEGGLLDENYEATVDLLEKGYLGEDGTVVGIYGGEFPFSETPSVPTVDSTNSKVEFDAENNKLNVTITVAPN